MKMFKSLPDKFYKRSSRDFWLHDDKWVSNGHFAIRRSMIENVSRYCVGEEVPISRVCPLNPGKTFRKTKHLYEGDLYLMRIFKSETGERVVFNEEYIKFLGVETILMDDIEGVGITPDEGIFIAPMRLPKEFKDET